MSAEGNASSQAVGLIANILEDQGSALKRIEEGQAEILKAIGKLFKTQEEQRADLDQLGKTAPVLQLRKQE